jgi:hypothetical protein
VVFNTPTRGEVEVSVAQAPRVAQELTALDWIGAAVASLGSVFCLQFPFLAAPWFKKMFADLGGELPGITHLGLTLWFPLILGFLPALALALAGAPRATLGIRRALILGAFFMSILSSGVCLYAMYAPIFALAGAIK